jgi:hypothetical protein
MTHPLWQPQDPTFLYWSNNQDTKKQLTYSKKYDGSPKPHPIAYMILFIPLIDGQQPLPKF